MNSYGNDTTWMRPITARLSLHARSALTCRYTHIQLVKWLCYYRGSNCERSQKSQRTCRWSHVIKIWLVRGPRLILVPFYVCINAPLTHDPFTFHACLLAPSTITVHPPCIARRCLINFRVWIPGVHSSSFRVATRSYNRRFDWLFATYYRIDNMSEFLLSSIISSKSYFFSILLRMFTMYLYKTTSLLSGLQVALFKHHLSYINIYILRIRIKQSGSQVPVVHGRSRSRCHAMTLQHSRGRVTRHGTVTVCNHL